MSAAVRALQGYQDPFRTMLWWSAAFHVALVVLVMIASRLGAEPSRLPQGIAWVVPGVPGPTQGMGGAPAPSSPELEDPEPEDAPRVVRPTQEQRDQMPLPDAPTTRRTRPKSSHQPPKDRARCAHYQHKSLQPTRASPSDRILGKRDITTVILPDAELKTFSLRTSSCSSHTSPQ